MRTAVVLFTRDLRVHDNPMLAAACASAESVLPLFVLDDGIRRTRYGVAANRDAFLFESLGDLDASLRKRGAALDVRSGDIVAETMRAARDVGTDTVFATADVSPYARERERRLAAELDLRLVEGHFVVPPGDIAPTGRDHYLVFSPYYRAWSDVALGSSHGAPRRIRLPDEYAPPLQIASRTAGGETAGRARMSRWLRTKLATYGAGHDALADDGTSRLSPYLHFGCISARELAVKAREQGGAAFVRQLCWRDFYAQLLAANPSTQTDDLRSRGDRWRDDADALEAWKAGLTGYPLVDAGMRQLAAEGWMHNRARLVTASFLVKHLGIDWREGAQHFFDLLVDGDMAQNIGNWQWVAGVGTDTRPNRVFNPVAQARKLDPAGAYVRRWVPELADVPAPAIFESAGRVKGYPAPIVDHATAVAEFRRRRGL